MRCPICDFEIKDSLISNHLPNFFQCPDCSGYFPAKKQEAPVYASNYFQEDIQQAKKSFFGCVLDIFLWMRRRKIENNLLSKDSYILDYGCGNGKLVAYLLGKGLKIDGYDPSHSAVDLAQKNNLPVFNEIPPKVYDLMMFWHSLEHADQPLADLMECKKRLSTNGKIIIAVPNGNSFDSYAKENWFGYDWPFHRIHFTPKSIKVLLDKAGLKLKSIDYFNPEYTLSSLSQTFLNFFMPKDVFYRMISNRRMGLGKMKSALLSVLSIIMLIFFSPLLLAVFLIELVTGRTGAIIVVAENGV